MSIHDAQGERRVFRRGGTAPIPCLPGCWTGGGVLAEIEALGLDLVEVRHLTLQRKSPESGGRRSP